MINNLPAFVESQTHALSTSPRIWFTFPICPTVSGWHELLKFTAFHRLFARLQSRTWKLGSLSNATSFSIPSSQIISLTYNCANLYTSQVWWICIKWTNLANLSIITQMEFCVSFSNLISSTLTLLGLCYDWGLHFEMVMTAYLLTHVIQLQCSCF